jgi:hypothetical protein
MSSATLTIPATRDGQLTTLNVKFRRDESIPVGEPGRWSMEFCDLQHPQLDAKDMIWRDYFGYAENAIEVGLDIGSLVVDTNEHGSFQIGTTYLEQLRRLAEDLGILDHTDHTPVVIRPGPRQRLSALASDSASRLVPSFVALTAERRTAIISV